MHPSYPKEDVVIDSVKAAVFLEFAIDFNVKLMIRAKLRGRKGDSSKGQKLTWYMQCRNYVFMYI